MCRTPLPKKKHQIFERPRFPTVPCVGLVTSGSFLSRLYTPHLPPDYWLSLNENRCLCVFATAVRFTACGHDPIFSNSGQTALDDTAMRYSRSRKELAIYGVLTRYPRPYRQGHGRQQHITLVGKAAAKLHSSVSLPRAAEPRKEAI